MVEKLYKGWRSAHLRPAWRGFHRYTDAVWLVPHFEKMLYDNAQLAQVYCRAYQATGKAFYRGVAERRWSMCCGDEPRAVLFPQDADSEELRASSLSDAGQIRAVLGERRQRSFSAFYDVTPMGIGKRRTSCGW